MLQRCSPLVGCANCKLVLYCGRDCQRSHWRHGGHKAVCAQATTQRIAAALNKPLDPRGTTQLCVAASKNETAKVRQLLDQGAAVNQARTDGITPLFLAAGQGHSEVVRLLIDGGAAVNQAMVEDGVTPLIVAVKKGHTEVARLLIDGGAAVDQSTTDTGLTPLYFATRQGHAELISLLEAGAVAVYQTSRRDIHGVISYI
mmetsp:Transcript_43405/g.80346  ORF Transcript_43405/g.80346 Transcript_43405/m.80346 type:complete len:201 (-) Transcript_43405:3-605(-)